MSTEIAETKDIEQIAEVSANTPLPINSEQSQTDRFVELALKSGDMQQLEKMLELKQRYDKEEARKAFTAALAAFKSEDITIEKDKLVSFRDSNNNLVAYRHATLGNIVEKVVPFMGKHGLSHRWITKQDGNITITCVLTHSAGHSEEVSLTAGADSSGKKNSIQQIASTITYLERYTFLAITGLATRDMEDDDGAGAEPEQSITLDQQTILKDSIKETGADEKLFLEYMQCKSLETMPASLFTRAKRALEAKKKK